MAPDCKQKLVTRSLQTGSQISSCFGLTSDRSVHSTELTDWRQRITGHGDGGESATPARVTKGWGDQVEEEDSSDQMGVPWFMKGPHDYTVGVEAVGAVVGFRRSLI